MKVDLIVTRHPALREFLIRKGIADETTPVVVHASPASVMGKHVAGVLPLFLAAIAASLTNVELSLPLEMRGKELSVEDMEKFCVGIRTYQVRSII